MKQNNIFKAVIAVLLVAVMMPTTAFASARMLCGHGDVEEYCKTTYSNIDGTSHTFTIVTTSICRECGFEQLSTSTPVTEYHSDNTPTLSYTFEESGEIIYAYECNCKCGYDYYLYYTYPLF